jgi:MFS family permease
MTRRLVFAIAAMGVAQTAVYMARPTTSYRLLGLGSGARAVGLVAASFALLPLFLAIPLGRFSDRRGGAPLLLVGCAVQTVGCVLLAAAGSALALAAASAVLGVGHLGLALGVQEMIARESDSARHDEHFGLLTAAVSLGQLVGPLLAGVVLGDRGGAALAAAAQHTLLLAAVIAALATVCALVADRSRASAEVPARAAGHREGSVRLIATTRGVPSGIFVSVAVLSAADVFTAYLPVLGEQRGIGPRIVGVLLATRAGASMASRVGVGAIVRRVGRVRLIVVGAVAAAAAFGAFTLTEDVVVLVVLSVVAGFGLGFGQPLSMTLVVQLVPASARATALAVRLTGNRLGQVAVPAAAGVVAGASGAGAVFWLVGGMLVASAVAIRRSGAAAAAAEPELVLAE